MTGNQDRLRRIPARCATSGDEWTRHMINALAVAIVGAAIASGVLASGVIL
jgi:hypothetical protein